MRYRYNVHLICGGEFEAEGKLNAKKYADKLLNGDRYILCEDSAGAEIIVCKDQIEYIEVNKINAKDKV